MSIEVIAPHLRNNLIVMRKAQGETGDNMCPVISYEGKRQLSNASDYLSRHVLKKDKLDNTLILAAALPIAETTATILAQQLHINQVLFTEILNACNLEQVKFLLSDAQSRREMADLISEFSPVIMITSKFLAPYLYSVLCENKVKSEYICLSRSDFINYSTTPRGVFRAIRNEMYS